MNDLTGRSLIRCPVVVSRRGAALCDALGTGADVRAGCAAGDYGSGFD